MGKKWRLEHANAFVPGYVEDFDDLEDFEPEGVTHQNSQKKEEVSTASDKSSTVERNNVNESESEGKEGESPTAAERESASEKPTLPANNSPSSERTTMKDMEKLQVTIHGASNLPKKGMLGQCNPYVVVVVEDQQIRSPAIRKSFNPGWNFTTVLEVEPDAGQQLEICVFDETIDGDDLIGETCIGVDDIIMTLKVKEIKEAWLDMDYCNNAQIMISTEMVTKDSRNDSATASTTEEVVSAKPSEEEEIATQKAKEENEAARRAEEEAQQEADLKAKQEEEENKILKAEAESKARKDEEEQRKK